jgi:hypothetical protein
MKNTFTILLLLLGLQSSNYSQSVSVQPNNGRRFDRLQVKITGVNTNFTSGSNTLQFFRNGTSTNNLRVDGLNPISATEMDVNLFIQASATLGNYNYMVSNPMFGNASSTNFFVVRPDTGTARILSITPNKIPVASSNYKVLVVGQNTHFFQASTTQITVFKNGSPTNQIDAGFDIRDNNTMVYMYVTTGGDALGYYDIEFKNIYETIYVTDALEVTNSIGLKEQTNFNTTVNVYPNPAKEQLTVQSKSDPIELVEIYTVTGNLVQTETPEKPCNAFEFKLSDMLVSKQAYLVRIKTKAGAYYQKIQID